MKNYHSWHSWHVLSWARLAGPSEGHSFRHSKSLRAFTRGRSEIYGSVQFLCRSTLASLFVSASLRHALSQTILAQRVTKGQGPEPKKYRLNSGPGRCHQICARGIPLISRGKQNSRPTAEVSLGLITALDVQMYTHLSWYKSGSIMTSSWQLWFNPACRPGWIHSNSIQYITGKESPLAQHIRDSQSYSRWEQFASSGGNRPSSLNDKPLEGGPRCAARLTQNAQGSWPSNKRCY